MQRRILKYFILFVSVTLTANSIIAEDYSWKPVLENRWDANSKYISDIDKKKKLVEEDEFREAQSEVSEGIFSQYKIISNIEKNRKKPSEQYLNIAKSEKYNNLLRAMLGFVKGKEKRNKILDKSTIDGLEILREGNFIDKICLHFNLDKLEEDKTIYGEEEAVRRYTEDISLDKLFFLTKILNYQRDNHALVENRQILELLCEDCDVMESLFQNLQEMKQAQDFLLLFNDQISFLNQCGFSDIEFEDCLQNFGYIQSDYTKKIIEYGQDTSIREYNNINFYQNKQKKDKIYTWGFFDWINPFAYIGWNFRHYKKIHLFFNVLHMKKMFFSLMLFLCFKFLLSRWGDGALKKKILDVIMFTSLFDFIFSFLPNINKDPFLPSLLSGLLLSFKVEVPFILIYLILSIIKYFASFFLLNPDDTLEKKNTAEKELLQEILASCNNEKEQNINSTDNVNQTQNQPEIRNNQPGPQIQETDFVDLFITFISDGLNFIYIKLEKFVDEIDIKNIFNECYNKIKDYFQYVAVGLAVLAFGAFLLYLFFLESRYKNTLHRYICKNLKQRTLYNARKYFNNMRSFYNTIKKNTSLYSKLKRRLKTCYLLFDKSAREKLTKKQESVLTILDMSDNDITEEEIVMFFALFDNEVKSTFKNAIREIYDISTYVNSAHLVSTKRYCIARFIKGDSNYIRMKSMLHPYLTEGIKNNVELGEKSRYRYRNMLFTGSNRSGKTTFIAAVALNVLLAHVFGIAFCEECILTPFDKIIAIFNYETDINDQQSKFSNEIKILRSLLSYLNENKDLKILFASDEQFSSTDPETANYLMSCFISSIYLQKNITSLNSTHLALPRKLAVLFQDSLGVCNVSLKTIIEENGNINFKRTLINRNGIMIGEQLAKNMGFFEHLDSNFVQRLKNIKY